MKKVSLITAMLFAVTTQIFAQIVRQNESAIIYFMPKTQVAVTLTYECVEQTPGIFYQYAQRYLGTNDIITETSTSYNIKHLALGIHTIADSTRAYKVPTQCMNHLQLLTLSKDGRLLGYNCPAPTHQPTEFVQTPSNSVLDKANSVLPLLEEQFIAGSTAKMAEGAAKMIYRIRETRLHLLAGEVEHLPADGLSMQLVLEQLNTQEQELVALFIGNTKVTEHKHTFYYTPSNSVNNEIIGRFSIHEGVVSMDNLSGEPIYINLTANKLTQYKAYTQPKKEVGHIYYNLPGSADVQIQYKDITVNQHFAIAQYGYAVPLANKMFFGSPNFSIIFDPETGNISSIKK
jgi:hypothetical protein